MISSKQLPFAAGILLLLVLAFLATAISGCKSSHQEKTETPKEEPKTTTAFTEVASGQYSGMKELDNYLITHVNQWRTVWKQIHTDVFPKPALPQIDFEEKTLVACFLGEQRSGGFRIEIKSMTCEGKDFDARLIHHEPGRNCLLTMALTQPFLVVAIDKCEAINKNFDIEGKVKDCN